MRLIEPHRAAECLLGRVVGFVSQHLLLGAVASASFLASMLLGAGLLGGGGTFLQRFDLIEEQPPREDAVESLLPAALTLDLQPGGSMEQHYAGGGFVHILPSMSARPNKGFFNVGLSYSQRRHALRQLDTLLNIER